MALVAFFFIAAGCAGGGASALTRRSETDPDVNRLPEVSATDAGNNGIVDSVTTHAYIYDAEGYL